MSKTPEPREVLARIRELENKIERLKGARSVAESQVEKTETEVSRLCLELNLEDPEDVEKHIQIVEREISRIDDEIERELEGL